MRKYFVYPVLFICGGVLYCLLEILWRGYTHWSMAVAGGVCLSLIYYIRHCCPNVSLVLRCITGAVIICTVEFAVGFIVNIILGWNVWDYSDRLFNLYGQICPLYAILWFLICFPGNFLCGMISNLFNTEKRKDHNNGSYYEKNPQ